MPTSGGFSPKGPGRRNGITATSQHRSHPSAGRKFADSFGNREGTGVDTNIANPGRESVKAGIHEGTTVVNAVQRGVGQPGSLLALDARRRRFESSLPDKLARRG